ncbi:MAG: hypothetical protein KDK34_11755, partial [Leptospiraceae bacterium]|nr:hypothetical protein [Leptospiraceae bacterium]
MSAKLSAKKRILQRTIALCTLLILPGITPSLWAETTSDIDSDDVIQGEHDFVFQEVLVHHLMDSVIFELHIGG